MICKNCGHLCKNNAKFCPSCGSELVMLEPILEYPILTIELDATIAYHVKKKSETITEGFFIKKTTIYESPILPRLATGTIIVRALDTKKNTISQDAVSIGYKLVDIFRNSEIQYIYEISKYDPLEEFILDKFGLYTNILSLMADIKQSIVVFYTGVSKYSESGGRERLGFGSKIYGDRQSSETRWFKGILKK